VNTHRQRGADAERTGQGCAQSSDAASRHRRSRLMKREMGDAEIRILDAHEVREETGSQTFVGGVPQSGFRRHPSAELPARARRRRGAARPSESSSTARAPAATRQWRRRCRNAGWRSAGAAGNHRHQQLLRSDPGNTVYAANIGAVPQRHHRHRKTVAEPLPAA